MEITYTPISAYKCTSFEAEIRSGKKVRHDLYIRGEGPPIVLIQELPGIGKETLRLADRLIDAGFQVYLPHLFGPLERVSMVGNTIRVLCMRREFSIFASHKSSPIVDWLKALCRHVKQESGYPGVGTIGMCLTGNFAILLMADDSVLAGVASQPSLPVLKGKQLHMSEYEKESIKERLDEVGPMLGFRFAADKLCPAARFEALQQQLNEGDQERIRLRTLPGKGHAVLTLDFVDEEGHPTFRALEEVISYFSEKLKT